MLLALLFVTLPFVVRSVQPVLMELERTWRRRPLARRRRIHRVPPHRPAQSVRRPSSPGAGLAFARAIGEFGSVVLISGNIPFKTEIAPVRIFGLVESGDSAGAAAWPSSCCCLVRGAADPELYRLGKEGR